MGNKQQARNEQANMQPEPGVSRFCYRIGSSLILLESDILAEVLTAQSIFPIPFAPEWCAGLTSLRGDLYPVIDMHKVVQGRPATDSCQLLFIQHPRFPPVVFTCDGYPRQLRLPMTALTEHLAENLPGWIPHILLHDNQSLLAADHGRLLRQIQRSANRQDATTHFSA
ncbi:MAG: chemotaxis protein CheW [Gammaproteobacteria bacterium]|nr:chemotaxis protein CheW [Gammaproteobacteria bacterium]MBU1725854.1 chemotaxis protein CheW [Gammaproteobacteria bacterium]MBU2005154.1 chemotaxis protein CheW [Gammaproteobacteria bacterium]